MTAAEGRRIVRTLAACAIVFALAACASKPAWKVQRSDLYRVVEHAGDEASPKLYFRVDTIVGAPGTALENMAHRTVRWCDAPGDCGDRDYSLEVILERADSEGDVVSFVSGADCTLVRHTMSADGTTLRSETYRSFQFTPEECEAGMRAPLPSKFVIVSSRTVSGQRLRPN